MLGWAGSALLVVSVMQTRILRLRLLNLAATIALLIFNWGISVWSMVAMNVVLAALNVYYIVRLQREHRRDGTAYEIVPVEHDDPVLAAFLRRNGADIARYHPSFRPAGVGARSSAFLIQHGNESAGVIVLHDAGEAAAQIDLDYVTQRFRDFSPGAFVFHESGLLASKGFRRVFTPPGLPGAYYARIGFVPAGDRWMLEVAPAA